MQAAIESAIDQANASSVKDMGQVMGFLKSNYAGQMDFSAASVAVKSRPVVKEHGLRDKPPSPFRAVLEDAQRQDAGHRQIFNEPCSFLGCRLRWQMIT